MAYCSKCGKELSEGSSFCQHCGENLSATPSSMHTSSMSSGLTKEDFAAFVGKNSEKYLTKFSKFNVGGIDSFKATWHWPAFFVPFWWMLYRKIYGWAILAFFLGIIPYVGFVIGFVWAIVANRIYYNHAKKKLLEIKQLHPAPETQKAVITVTGGVGNVALIIGVLIGLIAVIGILAAIAIPGYLGMQERSRKGVITKAASSAAPELQEWLESSLKSDDGSALIENDTDGNYVVDENDLTNSALADVGVCTQYVTMRNTVENLKSPWNDTTNLFTTAKTGNGQISCVQSDASITLAARDNRGTVIHSKTITSY